MAFYKSSFSFLFTPWITVFRVFVYLIHLLVLRDVGSAVKKIFSSNECIRFRFAEDTEQRRLEITILLAVSLGLIVVNLILLSMGLAYFCRM